MKSFVKSEQSGRSMMEALGYISITIMVSIAAAAAVNSGWYKFRLGRANQQLTDLKKIVSQRWVADEDYTDVKWKTLVDEGLIPGNMSDNDNQGRHAFNGVVEIGSNPASSGTPTSDEVAAGEMFCIQFSGVPRDACVELGSRVWLVNDGSDLEKMRINSTDFSWSGENNSKKLPAVVQEVGKACAQAGEWNNTITWYFN